MQVPTTTPVFPSQIAVRVGTGDTAFDLMQYTPGWNIVYKRSWSDPQWATWWHSGHTEAEARATFEELARDAFFGGNRYFRLIDPEGTIVGKHRRGDTAPPRYTQPA